MSSSDSDIFRARSQLGRAARARVVRHLSGLRADGRASVALGVASLSLAAREAGA
jgi:hypothetical protein